MGQLAVVPTREAGIRPNPESAIAGDEKSVRILWELLAGRRLPGKKTNAIGTKQARFRSEPEITVGRLGHREGCARRESVADSPGGMPVLADVEGRIERKSGPVASQQHTQGEHDENSSSHGREEGATTLAAASRHRIGAIATTGL